MILDTMKILILFKKVLELYFFQIPKKQTSKLYYNHVEFKYGEEEEGY